MNEYSAGDLSAPVQFSAGWDTTALMPGTYNLRAVASNTSDILVDSEVITVTVMSSSAEISESIDGEGNRTKREIISRGGVIPDRDHRRRLGSDPL